MNRRELITLAGGAAAWPVAARAQGAALPVVGVLETGNKADYSVRNGPAFSSGLAESGYADGGNVHVEYKFDDGRYELLPRLAANLIEMRVSVLAAIGGDVAALAALTATRSIPIVFAIGGDPVVLGLVPNLNHPNGNITGATWFTGNLAAKRIGLLREIAPSAKTIGLLVNPKNPRSVFETRDAMEAARAIGWKTQNLDVSSVQEIEPLISNLSETEDPVLLVTGDSFYGTRKTEIAEAARLHKIPAMFGLETYVKAGGLISYGAETVEVYRQAGAYVGKILRGARPGELPIVLPTEFKLAINLKAAKDIALKIPESILVLADEIIEE